MVKPSEDVAEKTKRMRALMDDGLAELAASWDGSKEMAGYVFQPAAGITPDIGWLDHSGSTDRLFELADMIGLQQPETKSLVQSMAVRVLQPLMSEAVHCVVVSHDAGVSLVEIPTQTLRNLQAAGTTEVARRARGALVKRSDRRALDELRVFFERGGAPDEAVVLIIDSTDPLSAPIARVLAQATRVELVDNAPLVLVTERLRLHEALRTLRPRASEWLTRPVPEACVRTICMAHGGISTGHLQITPAAQGSAKQS